MTATTAVIAFRPVGHALAAALRAVEQVLTHHGYPHPERSAEVLHLALEDELDAREPEPVH